MEHIAEDLNTDLQVSSFPLFWMTPVLRLIENCTGNDNGGEIVIGVTDSCKIGCIKCEIQVETQAVLTLIQERLDDIQFDRPALLSNEPHSEYSTHIKNDKYAIYLSTYQFDLGDQKIRMNSSIPTVIHNFFRNGYPLILNISVVLSFGQLYRDCMKNMIWQSLQNMS